ncbi:tRNA pseudouridine synthase B [Fructilactobacillus florum DSM 22689 = JCM 16035]|nr:tRNA pseudouridine synthase B [Fructilactobacillus florum DSM 22689 = JCM 16035]
MEMISGIIPLNKPVGMTSFDCVSRIRHLYNQKRVGHSGTLDPNVNGVLPICLGYATKLVDNLMATGKIYQGAITLGFATTTEDLDGTIIATDFDFKPLTDQQINNGLQHFLGDTIQIPPMYSAVKVKGRRLYDYARHGETVERPRRQIKITNFQQRCASWIDPISKTQTIYFTVHCSKGTYVRTLAVDFGKYFGVPAVMTQLTRMMSGGFTLAETVTLEELEQAAQTGQLAEKIQPLGRALQGLPTRELTASQFERVQHGGFLDARELASQKPILVLRYNNEDRATYHLDQSKQQYRPEKMFRLN